MHTWCALFSCIIIGVFPSRHHRVFWNLGLAESSLCSRVRNQQLPLCSVNSLNSCSAAGNFTLEFEVFSLAASSLHSQAGNQWLPLCFVALSILTLCWANLIQEFQGSGLAVSSPALVMRGSSGEAAECIYQDDHFALHTEGMLVFPLTGGPCLTVLCLHGCCQKTLCMAVKKGETHPLQCQSVLSSLTACSSLSSRFGLKVVGFWPCGKRPALWSRKPMTSASTLDSHTVSDNLGSKTSGFWLHSEQPALLSRKSTASADT